MIAIFRVATSQFRPIAVRSIAPLWRKHGICPSRTFNAENVHERTMSTKNHLPNMKTNVLPVDVRKIGKFNAKQAEDDILDELQIDFDASNDEGAKSLAEAANALRDADVPVAFPTETVYGLGADATRSSAVRGIYKAKQRPSDNPLIVHFASLKQLRKLLRPTQANDYTSKGQEHDAIPAIYRPLISRFWPGPLTIILPNPTNSPLAPEVTAGLDTFGARMPKHALALALITLADRPIAAPSANASTKPSPTAAEHVAYDLDGRIEMILDGGPCNVGVESTVVTGLSDPPRILRPGGVSLEQVRSCPGWERTEIGYKNVAETDSRPTAPGMKYRHYSPKANVVLYEVGTTPPDMRVLRNACTSGDKLGIITTKCWRMSNEISDLPILYLEQAPSRTSSGQTDPPTTPGFAGMLEMLENAPDARQALQVHNVSRERGSKKSSFQILELALGPNVTNIARGVFSALRELDHSEVDTIFVEGIDDEEGDTAAAVMNRLRKAAEVRMAN